MKKHQAFMKDLPNEHLIELGMAADTTTEVWKDIDTRLTDGEAWWLVDWEWLIEARTPTVPIASGIVAGTNACYLQLVRNTDNELLIPFTDDDLICEHFVGSYRVTAGAPNVEGPYRRDIKRFTTQRQLRLLFRTETNNGTFAGVTNVLRMKLRYFKTTAPKSGKHVTKLGSLEDL
jgi:hypothetical protein